MAGFIALYIFCIAIFAIITLLVGEKPKVVFTICAVMFIPALAGFAVVFPEVLARSFQ